MTPNEEFREKINITFFGKSKACVLCTTWDRLR